ncbi:hypothetical protein AB0K60_33690 [Thermopolyspora sp. NPDC052614]|uniref:hypothetical protein n=1 Tax=Thermopolyspora sp. NPDC052614 TaxID=3155682 RepID=UPI00342FFB64
MKALMKALMKQPPTSTRRPGLGGAPSAASEAGPRKTHSVLTVLGGTVVHDTGAVHQERGRPCADD